MKILQAFTLLLVVASGSAHAQQNYGGEIVSYNKFGEGMMMTRAKIVPLSGVVTNIFFFNRQDQPWNNNQWYEYDWEIRGKSPSSGWSQIRVRPQAGQTLKDAPVDVKAKIKLSNKLLHYVLIRKGNTYVYDIRENFKASTYNYKNAKAHNGNSASLLTQGARVYKTGGKLAHIPSWRYKGRVLRCHTDD